MPDLARERRALELFEAMLDQAEEKWPDWLDRMTRDDPELRQRVTEIAIADRSITLRTGGAFDDAGDETPPPENIGSYTITGLIGTGGMGSVYSAIRDKGDFDHDVAIKLIKPGLLSRRLVDHFARERQFLAHLNHPNIARLFDGGETDEGQPYFVMERVEGLPLPQWIMEANPSLEERLGIFEQVCDAVGYAHRKLVVHRDLTPSNILVDAEGRAKLIDFGIARPADEEESDRDSQTVRRLTLTPGFAAPERARGEPATTLSDIFSAGRVLASMTEKPRDPELQSIIDRASAAEPDERYGSMGELIADLRAYREGFPVSGLADSRRYRMRKFVARNKPQAILGIALIAALVGGLGLAGIGWDRAETARAQAEQRFAQVRELATFMQYDLYDQLEAVPGNTAALARIADRSRTYLEALAREDAPADLQFDVARGYMRLAEVAGSPVGANLGDRFAAGRFLGDAVALLERLHQAYPANRHYLRELAAAYYDLAVFRFIAEDDNEGAIEAADRSATLYRKLLDSGDATRQDRLDWYMARIEAAKPFVWIDRGEEGIERLSAVGDELDALAREDGFADTELGMVRAAAHSALANTMAWHYPTDDPRYRRSAVEAQRAVDLYETAMRDPNAAERAETSLLSALYNQGLILPYMGEAVAGLRALERAATIADRRIAADPEDAGMVRRREAVHSQMIVVLGDLGRHAEAQRIAAGIAARREDRARAQPDNPGLARDAANSLHIYADALLAGGRHDQACRQFRRARDAYRAVDARWPLSELDREHQIAPLEAALADCPGQNRRG